MSPGYALSRPPRLPRNPLALRVDGPQVQHFLPSSIRLIQRLKTGHPEYLRLALLNSNDGDPPRASAIRYRDSLCDHVDPAGFLLEISQLHPRHHHATVLQTAATDRCLGAYRRQPTPNYLFWDVQPLAVPPFIFSVYGFFLSSCGVFSNIA